MSHVSGTGGDESTGHTQMWPPGTVHLEDMRGPAGGRIILQPQPTQDPNDPLNWSKKRKYLNFGLACLYVIMVNESINAPTPTWGPMHEELRFSYEILNDSYAIGCACLGIGAVILVPLSLKLGRRPLYLFSTIIQFGVSIWSAKMQTVADLMLINTVQCFFGALEEVIVQMTVSDIFFVHERGMMNSIYIWSFKLTTSLGPLIAGYITKGQGWRWVWWWNTIFFGICIFIVGFGYEETKYAPPPSVSALSGSGELYENPTHFDDDPDNKVKNLARKSVVKYHTQFDQEVTPQPLHTLSEGDLSHSRATMDPEIPMKTYWQRLAITTTSSSRKGRNSFFRHLYQPFVLLLTIPAIAYTALVYGILVGLGDVMSTTLSTFMTQPPYNFTSDKIGLMNLPIIIGITIGTLVGGPISDWIILYFSRRNNGIYEPEYRLWAMIPFVPFIPAGAVIFSIGLSNGLSWPVIAVGFALYFVGIAPINSITITYLTDSYRDVSTFIPFHGKPGLY